MAKTRKQKEETVQQLSEKLNRAKAIVFTDYKGLNMKQLSDLRNKLREVQGEFSITKNTLLDKAIETTDYRGRRKTEDVFDGPTATLFAYDDEISPIKILVKSLADSALGKIKSGFLGQLSLDETRIIQLSSLPTKDELRGQVVGLIASPLQGILSVLQGNLRNLVYALNQISALPNR